MIEQNRLYLPDISKPLKKKGKCGVRPRNSPAGAAVTTPVALSLVCYPGSRKHSKLGQFTCKRWGLRHPLNSSSHTSTTSSMTRQHSHNRSKKICCGLCCHLIPLKELTLVFVHCLHLQNRAQSIDVSATGPSFIFDLMEPSGI